MALAGGIRAPPGTCSSFILRESITKTQFFCDYKLTPIWFEANFLEPIFDF